MNELSPNGKQVWSFTSDGGLRHFDAETGWKAKRLDTPPTWNGESKEFAMTFSSDGLFLYAMHSKGEVHRRDLKANKWLPPLTNVRQGTLMSNSNGTRLFVLGTDGVLGRYDLTTLKALPAPAGFEGALRSTASPDGKHLVIVAGKEVVRLQVLDAKGRLEWSDGPYDSGCSPCWVAVHSTKSAFSE